MTQIVCNRIKTPDGMVLTSRTRHDYQTYDDANGWEYMVDGGTEYLRRTSHYAEFMYEELSVYVTDSHEEIREVFDWGTYGPDGDQPLHYMLLKDMDTDHIEKVLENVPSLPDWREKIFYDELEHRSK